jgi:serine/threonine-protein kinase
MDATERDEWREADRLLASLIDLEPEERARRLERVEASDGVRAKLAILLGNTGRDHRILDAPSPACWAGRPASSADGNDALVGRRFGEWQLVGLLGRGGMAAVYRAERIGGDYEQQAAVKLLSVVLRSPADQARFRRERRILAQLQHPHIASLLDGGVGEDGTPYLAMRLVDGERIDDHCQRHALDAAACVRLILQVCDAVALANRQLVVHRDIKPGNILVDASGRATLLDFGIARLLDADTTGDASGETTVTRAFTPGYAAPEQRAGSRHFGTAVDVFGIGAVLYRLLVGQPPPLDARGEVERASTLARRSGAEARAHELRGDLDAILAQALASDPAQRYPAAAALAADLEAWLDNHPIQARRTNPWVRARKLVRRNPASAALAALCVVVAGIGTGVAIVNHVELARRASDLQAVVGFQADMLKEIDPESVGARLRQSLEDATAGDPGAPTTQLARIDYTGLAVDLLDHAVLSRAHDSLNEQFSDQPRVRASLLQTLASTYIDLGLLDKAAPVQDAATRLFKQTLGIGDPETLASIREQADLAYRRDAADGEALQRRMLALHERHLGADSFDTAKARNLLGHWLMQHGSVEEAERVLREAAESMIRLRGANDPETIGARADYYQAVVRAGRYAEAIALLRGVLADSRRVYGEDAMWTLSIKSNLAYALERNDGDDEAQSLKREVYESRRRTLGASHQRTLLALNNLAAGPRKRGRFATAEPMQREAYEGFRKALGPDHWLTLRTQLNLGAVELGLGREAEAAQLLGDGLERWNATQDGSDAPIAIARRQLGEAQLALGHHADAAQSLHAAWDSAVALDDTAGQRETATLLARLYEQAGDDARHAEWQARAHGAGNAEQVPARGEPVTSAKTGGGAPL